MPLAIKSPLLAFTLLLVGAYFTLPLATAASEKAPINPSGFIIHRGTNLSHWLSQDFGWAPRESFITENDIRFIVRSGFDHVRLPIDEKELWLSDGKSNEAAFKLLQDALGWCRKHRLRVILDLHTVNAHHFNAVNEGLTNTLWSDPAAQAHFLSLWRELSVRLRAFPADFLAYEIMNEPVADNHEDWNKLVASTLKQIRETEPTRVIVVGSNRWQSPHTFPFLSVPANDKNIILSTHTYAPMMFTHHEAEWVPIKGYKGPVHYPGPTLEKADYDRLMECGDTSITHLVNNAKDNWNAARLHQELEPAIKRARELGLQLYCGEFGCLPTVPRTDRLAYYRDVVGVFNTEQIAFANWEYKGDFGVFEWHGLKFMGGAPDVELLEILCGKR